MLVVVVVSAPLGWMAERRYRFQTLRTKHELRARQLMAKERELVAQAQTDPDKAKRVNWVNVLDVGRVPETKFTELIMRHFELEGMYKRAASRPWEPLPPVPRDLE
jgi:hypothetical protein